MAARSQGHRKPGRARDVHGSEDARVKAQKPEREGEGAGGSRRGGTACRPRDGESRGLASDRDATPSKMQWRACEPVGSCLHGVF
jgi:hypothetical protein